MQSLVKKRAGKYIKYLIEYELHRVLRVFMILGDCLFFAQIPDEGSSAGEEWITRDRKCQLFV